MDEVRGKPLVRPCQSLSSSPARAGAGANDHLELDGAARHVQSTLATTRVRGRLALQIQTQINQGIGRAGDTA